VVRSFENEPKAGINIRAGAWNVDCVGVSQKTPAGAFRKLAVRVEVICCYASSIPNQHATRWRRFFLAVQIDPDSSVVLTIAAVSLRYSNPFHRSPQYATPHKARVLKGSAGRLRTNRSPKHRSTAVEL
jgi:hypothetical protein